MQPHDPDARSRLSALSRQLSQERDRPAEAPPTAPTPPAHPGPVHDGRTLDGGSAFLTPPQPVPQTPGGRAVQKLALAAILDSPYQPRKRTLGRRDVDDLMASIAAVGQQSPIIVSPAPDGRWFVHSGHRRCVALRFLGATTVDAEVRAELTEPEARRLAIAENLGREDLTPYELATALEQYCAACAGASIEEAATQLGLSRPTAYRLKAILTASAPLKDVIRDHAIAAKPADALARLDAKDPRRALRLAKRYAAGKATSADIEQALRGASKQAVGLQRASKDVEFVADARSLKLRITLERDVLAPGQIERATKAIAELLGYLGVGPVTPTAPVVGEESVA